MMMNSNYNCTFKSPFNIGDDYIGAESTCMDLQNDIVAEHYSATSKTTSEDAALKSRGKNKVMREFPPPIPLLSSSNNQNLQLSWALKRYCTSDGRLILKEQKVKKQHYQYFRAQRSNGRLTLQLVDPFIDEEVEDRGVADSDDEHNTSVISGASDEEVPMENDDGGGTNSSLNCNIAGSAPSSIFGVTMHQIRTVHG